MGTKTSTGNVSYDLKRFSGIKRDYTEQEVEKLRGTFNIEYTLCKNQSQKLWKLLNSEPYVNTLGSLSGNQAVQHAKAGLKAIYLSGWQLPRMQIALAKCILIKVYILTTVLLNWLKQ